MKQPLMSTRLHLKNTKQNSKGTKVNLQHAKANPGKFHEMRATATRFDVKDGQYGWYALGAIKDEPGNEEDVLFAVKKGETLVDANTAMKLCIWAVRYDANDGKYKAYFKGTVAKQLQDTPQSPPQPANYQQPTPQGKKEPVTQNDAYKMVRDNVVCAFIQSGELKLDDLSTEVATAINKWVKFILTNDNPNWVGDNPEAPKDDDIPF